MKLTDLQAARIIASSEAKDKLQENGKININFSPKDFLIISTILNMGLAAGINSELASNLTNFLNLEVTAKDLDDIIKTHFPV